MDESQLHNGGQKNLDTKEYIHDISIYRHSSLCIKFKKYTNRPNSSLVIKVRIRVTSWWGDCFQRGLGESTRCWQPPVSWSGSGWQGCLHQEKTLSCIPETTVLFYFTLRRLTLNAKLSKILRRMRANPIISFHGSNFDTDCLLHFQFPPPPPPPNVTSLGHPWPFIQNSLPRPLAVLSFLLLLS